MTWTVTFAQTTDKPGVGTLTANYDDGVGITCHWSDRVDTNSDFGAFIARCQETLAKTTADSANILAIVAKIEGVLNK